MGGEMGVAKLNERVANLLADTLSTMACFWVITSMVVVVLLWQRPDTIVGWITYISTAIFQASALPVLAFVSKKEGATQQALLQETHDTTMESLKLIKQDLDIASEERDDLKETLNQVMQSHEDIKKLVVIIHNTFVSKIYPEGDDV
jgi:hypothetical protein